MFSVAEKSFSKYLFYRQQEILRCLFIIALYLCYNLFL